MAEALYEVGDGEGQAEVGSHGKVTTVYERNATVITVVCPVVS